MTRRADFDGTLQREVLTHFRLASGVGRTQIAARLGYDHDTYRRIEIGQTELRVSQIPSFARAYGISPRDLSEALGLLAEETAPPVDLEAELGRMFPDDPARVARILRSIRDWEPQAQRVALDMVEILETSNPPVSSRRGA